MSKIPRTYKRMDESEFTDALRKEAARFGSVTRPSLLGLDDFLHRCNLARLGMYSDWSVSFDMENFTCLPGLFEDNGGSLVGLRHLKGFRFLGCLAGGDWEEPVFFIIYFDWDGKSRLYIPENGNVFCKEHRCAYGSCDSDKEGCDLEAHASDLYNWTAIINDIKKQFALDVTSELPDAIPEAASLPIASVLDALATCVSRAYWHGSNVRCIDDFESNADECNVSCRHWDFCVAQNKLKIAMEALEHES